MNVRHEPPEERNAPRVVEIGGGGLFAYEFPDTTLRVWTNLHVDRSAEPRLTPWGFDNVAAAFRLVRSPDTDFIVWHQLAYAPWDLSFVGRSLARLGWRAVPFLLKYLASFALVLAARRPIVVIDTGDYMSVPRHTLWVMGRAVLTYKRELPSDRWRVLAGTLHRRQPARRMRRRAGLEAVLRRIRPMSLGALVAPSPPLPMAPSEKTVDVFFAGETETNSTMRSDGVKELEELRAQGLVVEVLRERLPLEEFYRRCARAWLVWSPEGNGWECYRHYEALLCASVPLINRPWIMRHRPLQDGEHCVFYDPEPGGLVRAATAALGDRQRLVAMAEAGRSFVLAHHTRTACCAHIMAELRAARAGAGADAP